MKEAEARAAVMEKELVAKLSEANSATMVAQEREDRTKRLEALILEREQQVWVFITSPISKYSISANSFVIWICPIGLRKSHPL